MTLLTSTLHTYEEKICTRKYIKKFLRHSQSLNKKVHNDIDLNDNAVSFHLTVDTQRPTLTFIDI